MYKILNFRLEDGRTIGIKLVYNENDNLFSTCMTCEFLEEMTNLLQDFPVVKASVVTIP